MAVATDHAPQPVMSHLDALLADRALPDLRARLSELDGWARHDLASIEAELSRLGDGTLVGKSARHLLARGGKRLRPLCVTLAARLGDGVTDAAREIAVAVELVHNATLLHDDVIDLGEVRRGAPAARMLYGNAASIFAGDFLLVEAIRRVERTRVPGELDRMLGTIDTMIEAEALQLLRKGDLTTDIATYLHVVEGKTAALFRWALGAGARTGGLGERAQAAIDRYARHLGVAFQLIDDVLDFAGDTATLGKAPLVDLREGKLTCPLLLGLPRDPALGPAIREALETPVDQPLAAALCATVLGSLERTGALAEARASAAAHIATAIEALAPLPQTAARAALVTIAEATLSRER